jgi:peptidoglycan biosynthesis protein MviN/MurJ (putative lipid II flippase)
VLNVGLDLVLVPAYGVTGAALGWAASILVKNLLALWQVNGSHSMHPLGPGTRAAMASCLISFGAVVGLARLVLGDTPPAFVVCGSLGALVFFLLVGRKRDVLELAALESVVRRRQRASS